MYKLYYTVWILLMCGGAQANILACCTYLCNYLFARTDGIGMNNWRIIYSYLHSACVYMYVCAYIVRIPVIKTLISMASYAESLDSAMCWRHTHTHGQADIQCTNTTCVIKYVLVGLGFVQKVKCHYKSVNHTVCILIRSRLLVTETHLQITMHMANARRITNN